jgi:rhamnose transport system substrate-binding protein
MRSTQFRVLAGVAVVGMLSLAGCATGGGNPGADDDGCIDGPITVGIIPKLGDDPYMTTHRDGAIKAADEIGDGDEVVYTSPSEATGAAQIPFVQQLISQKVDVIAISGSDLDGAKAELQQAREAGIKVLSYDSDVASDARSLFINQAATEELGTAMLDSMSEMLGGEGQFAILSSTQTAVNQNAWIDDMKARLESDAAFANLELVDVAYGEEKADVSANRAKELVAKYPDLRGIIVPAGISLPAAATALDESGDLGRVKLTGLAPVSLIRDYIKSGDVQDIWWNVTDLGYLTMYAAKALASCETEGATGDTFDAGELGTYTVGENGVVILGPAVVATPENADDFAF